jgi:hypothetical protein
MPVDFGRRPGVANYLGCLEMPEPIASALDLSCGKCGSNRLRFPASDEGLVTCEDCGHAVLSLGELKVRVAEQMSTRPQEEQGHPADRAGLRERHTSEVAASQAELKESIAETDRLVDESDDMLRRHRRECDEDEAS